MSLLGDNTEESTTETTQTTETTTTETTDWRASLPEDLRAEPSLQVFKDPIALAKSYVHAQRQIGADKIVLPNEKYATDEDWQAVYTKLGRPETPDGYELKAGEGMDEQFVAQFAEQAHKAGLRPNQVKGLFSWYQEQVETRQAEAEKHQEIQQEKELTELKNEWGKAYDTRLMEAKTLYRKYIPEDVQKYMDQKGFSSDPTLVKAFAVLADKFLAEGERVGEGEGQRTMSPKDAQEAIGRIWGDASHAYHKGHPDARAEMDRLYKLAYPS